MSLSQGNALHLPYADGVFHCCVTSPPYWGLRDYGTARWEGGDQDCDHLAGPLASAKSGLNNGRGVAPNEKVRTDGMPYRDICGKCGAVRIDNQLGLEPTPDAYVANMVAVFREVRRVLRDDGVCWLNLGDSYAGSGKGRDADGTHQLGGKQGTNGGTVVGLLDKTPSGDGLKPKDLVGIPWRVALALQADGWWLRSDVIWAKPNPMPESVTDRPTRSHEYLFLLTKAARYFWDAEAVREASIEPIRAREKNNGESAVDTKMRGHDGMCGNNGTRNIRSVWTVATAPYSGAHFATFPPALVEPCVKAGTSERGVCPVCGKPWVRVVERTNGTRTIGNPKFCKSQPVPGDDREYGGNRRAGDPSTTTIGWRPTCDHDAAPVPALVLDPFCGSGTVGEVCRGLRRRFVGLDLSAEYLARNALPRAELKTCQAAIAELPMFAGV